MTGNKITKPLVNLRAQTNKCKCTMFIASAGDHIFADKFYDQKFDFQLEVFS
jgi:hypothetical protein